MSIRPLGLPALSSPLRLQALDARRHHRAGQANPAGTLEKAAAALNPLSSPEDEMKASMDKFRKPKASMRSWTCRRAEHGHRDGFRRPRPLPDEDADGNQVIIGDTMYMQVEGRSMKMPLPAGTLTQWRDPLRIEEHKAGMSVESLGTDSVDGQLAKKYLVKHTEPQAQRVHFLDRRRWPALAL